MIASPVKFIPVLSEESHFHFIVRNSNEASIKSLYLVPGNIYFYIFELKELLNNLVGV